MQQLNSSGALYNDALGDHLDSLVSALGYSAFSKAGLAIGSGSKAKVLITNTVNFTNNGVMLQKATAEIAFTATTHDIPANADSVQEACYLLSLNSSGTATLTMGTIATGSGNAVVPACPAGNTPIGYVRIAIAAGATPFDASTDLLDAAHITDTYVDMGLRFGKFGAAYEIGGVTAE